MTNIRLNKLEKFAIIICGLCIGGMIIGQISGKFRFSELRIIYQICWISCYVLVLSSFVWSGANAVLILQQKNYNLKRRLIWAFISLLPILYFTLMMTIAMSLSALSASSA